MIRLILFFFPLSIFAQGIEFQELTWQQALAKARASKKIIFVDAYTTWCQPCRVLEKYTFTNENVGKFFNSSFVNVRFDMEKYPGVEIAETYNIDTYPTLLFVDGDGKMVHRGCGTHEPDELLALAENALTPETTLTRLSERFESGEREIELMDQYLQASEKACRETEEILRKFFSDVSNEDLPKNQNWYIMREYVFDIYSEQFQYLLKNQGTFVKFIDEQEIQNKIHDTFMLTFIELSESDYPLFAIKSLRFVAQQNTFKSRTDFLHYLNFAEGELTDNWELYAEGAVGFMKIETEDPELIMDIAWKFYLFVKDKDKIFKALNWMKFILDNNDPIPSYIDTYASLLYKLGKKENSVKFAEQALQLAQSWGEDTEHYEHQLKKFKTGLR